jgi:hypothetical protein
MTHLTEAEFVDLVDATLAPSRAAHLMAHLGACADCRAIAATMREALTRAANAEMPEPSPLFWEHFSARVHEGVQAVDAPESSRWLALAPPLKWTVAGALLTLVLVAGVWVAVWQASAPASSRRTSVATTATVADAAAGSDDGRDTLDAESPESDAAWALVRAVADDVSWDDAAADRLGVRPGSVEHAMATLTGAERSELVRLLQAETKQPGA